MLRLARFALLVAPLTLSSACSIKGMVLNQTINALTTGTGGFGTDGDPELVRDAVPFGLKTLESLHAEAPDHEALNLSLCSGFTQYAYAFVQLDGDLVKYEDYDTYKAKQARAHRLYLRGLDYGKQALELASPGFIAQFLADADKAAATLGKDDVALIYWVGASWAGAIATSSGDLALLADLGRVRTLLARGLALDEGFDTGAFHELFIALDMAPSGGGADSAKAHYQRALSIAEGQKAGPHVSYAESVLVMTQDYEGFKEVMGTALAINPDEFPANRLVNILAQRKAQYLLEHTEDLFGI